MKTQLIFKEIKHYLIFLSNADEKLNEWLCSRYGEGKYAAFESVCDVENTDGKIVIYKNDLLYCRSLNNKGDYEFVCIGRGYE